MTDIALTEWEHQPHVLDVLTSREMGEWLGRRDNRLLQEIRQEIAENGNSDINTQVVLHIIDKYIKEIADEADN